MFKIDRIYGFATQNLIHTIRVEGRKEQIDNLEIYLICDSDFKLSGSYIYDDIEWIVDFYILHKLEDIKRCTQLYIEISNISFKNIYSINLNIDLNDPFILDFD